jgi:hypothetical protein
MLGSGIFRRNQIFALHGNPRQRGGAAASRNRHPHGPGCEFDEGVRLVVRQTLLLVGIGLILGLAGSLAFGRFIADELYGVTPTDPRTFVIVLAGLVAVAVIASLVPTVRVARPSPSVTNDPRRLGAASAHELSREDYIAAGSWCLVLPLRRAVSVNWSVPRPTQAFQEMVSHFGSGECCAAASTPRNTILEKVFDKRSVCKCNLLIAHPSCIRRGRPRSFGTRGW